MDNNHNTYPNEQLATTSGVKRKVNFRRSSSSSSSSSSSNSSCSSQSSRDSRNKKKKTSHRRSKKHKYDRRLIEKLSKEVGELRKNFAGYGDRNYLDNDNASCISDVSRDLYDNYCVDASQASPSCNISDTVVPHLSFDFETKLKDPAIPKAPQEYLKMLDEVQRFGSSTWSDVRYADTQKLYNHSPGFIELETNEEVKAYDNTRHLAYSDKSYAAFTFCILKQKEVVLNGLRNLLIWSQTPEASLNNLNSKIDELFVKGEFHKVSTDLLQMACGHRAEAVEMRRDAVLKYARDPLFKASLNKIPPSKTHIFSSEAFTNALEKAGGVRRAFWPAKQANSGNASRAKPSSTARHPSQGQAFHHVPPRGTSAYNCCEPAPAAYMYGHHNQPSQGGHHCHCPPKGHSHSNIEHTHYNHNNRGGSFRARGSRSRHQTQRGTKRSFSPSCNRNNKRQRQ
ncbi:hypothetical protein B5X24_HaOG203019 [Helicoverpa armigera]|uniref:Uncharacterized protein n=1 Tax=Helicoverpa armigera TaxID=29058 RepID=A0A2W1BVV2_HELAM|nr:hypothetical protein B5X24_HaOG203019 [Helicoverpa armigera]